MTRPVCVQEGAAINGSTRRAMNVPWVAAGGRSGLPRASLRYRQPVYWRWMMRVELGAFQVFGLLMLVVVTVFVSVGVDLWISSKLRRDKDPASRIPKGLWIRFPAHVAVAVVVALAAFDVGRPVGGLVAFDENGDPQRATMQVIVTGGGKTKVDHLVLRTLGPGGETQALHRVGYASGREPLPATPAFWDGEQVRSMVTLEVLASAEDVRSSTPALDGAESRLLSSKGDQATFQRRDGTGVRVSASEVAGERDAPSPGCRLDVTFIRDAKVEGLIAPKVVPWTSPRPGCPSTPPDDVQLFRSDDAAFGDVSTMLTLRDGDRTLWQVSLPEITAAEQPRVLGAFPTSEALTLVAADDDELLFAKLGWADGAVSSVVRWR